jgi:drug/metabolite transporter (DMT)-like permease
LLYFIITLIFFSSIEVVSKDLMNYLGPFEMTFIRFMIGLLGIFAYSLFTGDFKDLKKLGYKDYRSYAVLGFINIFFSMTMLQYAIKYGEPAVVALIISSNPIFVYIISLSMKHEILSGRKVAGFILGILGLSVVLIKDLGSIRFETGALFALAGAVSFAYFTILNRDAVARNKPMIVNIGSFSFGLIYILIYFLISGSVDVSPVLFDSGIRTIKILYLGIFVTGISYITFLTAIKKMGPVASSLIFMFKPAVAALLAVLLLSQTVTLNFFIGLILSALGSYLILKNKPSNQTEPECAK